MRDADTRRDLLTEQFAGANRHERSGFALETTGCCPSQAAGGSALSLGVKGHYETQFQIFRPGSDMLRRRLSPVFGLAPPSANIAEHSAHRRHGFGQGVHSIPATDVSPRSPSDDESYAAGHRW